MKFDRISVIFRLHGLSAVFRNFLKIVKTLEPKTYITILSIPSVISGRNIKGSSFPTLCHIFSISLGPYRESLLRGRTCYLPKYVGRVTAEVRTVFLCHRFELSSPFRGILRRSSEAINSPLITFGGSKYANILQIRGGVALHTNICPEIFFDHLKGYLSAF